MASLPLTIDTPFPGTNARPGQYVGAPSAGLTGTYSSGNAVSPTASQPQYLTPVNGGSVARSINGAAPISGQNKTTSTINPNQTFTTQTAQPSQLQQLQAIGGDRNPYQEDLYQKLLAELNGGQDETNRLIDEAYSASAGYLDQAESALRGDYPTILSEIDAQRQAAQRTADTGKSQTLGTIDEQQTTATQRNQNVMADARRLYDELRRGYMQRFGGASSAGQAATELGNLEQQRQSGRVQQDFGNTLRQIETARTQVEQKYQDQIYQLEQTTNQAKNEANRDFQNKLLQISQSRAENEQAKAQARLQALQDLRNKVYQINLQNLQFQQTLQAQKQQATQSLASYATQLGGLGEQATNATSAFDPTISSNLNVGDAFGSGGLTLDSQYTGQIQKKPEDFLQGIIGGGSSLVRNLFNL